MNEKNAKLQSDIKNWVNSLKECKKIQTPLFNLHPKDRFIWRTPDGEDSAIELMFLERFFWHEIPRVRAVCYKDVYDLKSVYAGFTDFKVGEIYEFSISDWVTYLSFDGTDFEKCRSCSTRLISDTLSDRYGDYCPNERCISNGTPPKFSKKIS